MSCEKSDYDIVCFNLLVLFYGIESVIEIASFTRALQRTSCGRQFAFNDGFHFNALFQQWCKQKWSRRGHEVAF